MKASKASPVTAPTWLTEQPYAHRGLHGGTVVENSLGAFEAAVRSGVGIELDVQLSLDDVPVVFHDVSLSRLTGWDRQVRDVTYQQVRKHPLLGSGERVPSLLHVLDLVAGQVPLLIEIKPGWRKERVRSTLRLLRSYDGPVALQSFDPDLVRVARDESRYPVGQIIGRYKDPGLPKPFRKDLMSLWSDKEWPRPSFAAYDVKKLSLEASTALRQDLPVLTWTVNSEMKNRTAELLADQVIFENGTDGELDLSAWRQ